MNKKWNVVKTKPIVKQKKVKTTNGDQVRKVITVIPPKKSEIVIQPATAIKTEENSHLRIENRWIQV